MLCALHLDSLLTRTLLLKLARVSVMVVIMGPDVDDGVASLIQEQFLCSLVIVGLVLVRSQAEVTFSQHHARL